MWQLFAFLVDMGRSKSDRWTHGTERR